MGKRNGRAERRIRLCTRQTLDSDMEVGKLQD